jgi:ubiquinone/menaquinone biosynthesis C-methylase UbiE
MKKNNIQKQWNKATESWVDFVRKRKDYTREELNNPAMFKMLGNISGKRVLDLGCGEGYNSRIMAGKKAKIIGVDLSAKLIDCAIREEKRKKLGIDYYVRNAADLRLFKNNTFDVVASFNVLQDVENYQAAIKEAARVLQKMGRFIFVIPHPCFEIRMKNGKMLGGWEYKKEAKDKAMKNALYYKVDRYFDIHKYVIPWNMKRLIRHFKTTSFHRTLSDYIDALYKAGLMISRLKEPQPTKRGLRKYPIYFGGNLRIPQSIVIEAIKQK